MSSFGNSPAGRSEWEGYGEGFLRQEFHVEAFFPPPFSLVLPTLCLPREGTGPILTPRTAAQTFMLINSGV